MITMMSLVASVFAAGCPVEIDRIPEPFFSITLPLLITLIVFIFTTYSGMIKPLTEINERTRRIERDIKESLINTVKTTTSP